MKTENDMLDLKKAFVQASQKMKVTAQAFYTAAVEQGLESGNWNWLADFIKTALERKAMDAIRLRKLLNKTNPNLNLKVPKDDSPFIIKQGEGFNKEDTVVVQDIFANELGLPKETLVYDEERFFKIIQANIKKATKAGIAKEKLVSCWDKALTA